MARTQAEYEENSHPVTASTNVLHFAMGRKRRSSNVVEAQPNARVANGRRVVLHSKFGSFNGLPLPDPNGINTKEQRLSRSISIGHKLRKRGCRGGRDKKSLELKHVLSDKCLPDKRSRRCDVETRSNASRPSRRDNGNFNRDARHKQEKTLGRRRRRVDEIAKFLQKSSQWKSLRLFDEKRAAMTGRQDDSSAVTLIKHEDRNINSDQGATGEDSGKTAALQGRTKKTKRAASDVRLDTIFQKMGAVYDPKFNIIDITPETVSKDFEDLDNFIRRKADLQRLIIEQQQHKVYFKWNAKKCEDMERKQRWRLMKLRRKLEQARERICSIDVNLCKERIRQHVSMKAPDI